LAKKHAHRNAATGGSDPDKAFGRIDCQKSGVAPARFTLFCAVTFAEVVVGKRFRMNSVGRALGKGVAVLKVQGVILTVFTLFTLLPTHVSSKNSATHAAKHRKESPRGLERPQASLWPRNRVQKWGRSSPTQGFARVQIDRRAMRNLLLLGHLLDRQGDREGDAYGDLCISCTLHLPALLKVMDSLQHRPLLY